MATTTEYNGRSFYKDIDGVLYEYQLRPTPPESVYWETYKARLSDIKVLGVRSSDEKRRVAKEIQLDINQEVTK